MADTTRFKSTFGFVDLLFNLLVGFTFLFVLAFILINPIAKKDILEAKAEYLIIMTWNDKSTNDIDVWIKDNYGNMVSFRNKNIALVNIDRDDRGTLNDTFEERGLGSDKKKVETFKVNREVVSIRSKSPREFNITAHYYNYNSDKMEEDVWFELIKVNPYKILKRKKIRLIKPRQEKHVFKFKVIEGGDVVFIESDELNTVGEVFTEDSNYPIIENQTYPNLFPPIPPNQRQ